MLKYKFECSLVFCGVNTGMSNHHYIEFRHTSDIILAFCNNFVSLTHSLIISWLSAKKVFCCCSFQIFMLNIQFLSYSLTPPHSSSISSSQQLHVKMKKGYGSGRRYDWILTFITLVNIKILERSLALFYQFDEYNPPQL